MVARLDRLRSPSHCPDDRRLAAWVDLQLLTEEGLAATTDHAVLDAQLGPLKTRFKSWRADLDPAIMNGTS